MGLVDPKWPLSPRAADSPAWDSLSSAEQERYDHMMAIYAAMIEAIDRKAVAYLPALKIKGLNDPVVQVIEEASGEVVYTLRIKGNQFRPKVFAREKYSVNIGEPGAPKFKTLAGVVAVEESDSAIIEVVFDGK